MEDKDENENEGTNTDGANWEAVLIELVRCVGRWEPDARVIGNIRAEDIQVACLTAYCLAQGYLEKRTIIRK